MPIFNTQPKTAIGARAPPGRFGKDPYCNAMQKTLALRKSQDHACRVRVRENLGSRAEPTRIDVCTVRWAHAHAAVILQVCAEIRKNQPARSSDRNHNHGQFSAVVVRDMQGNLCCENQSQ